MRRVIEHAVRRFVVLAATTGLILLFGSAAEAFRDKQHCEPLLRR